MIYKHNNVEDAVSELLGKLLPYLSHSDTNLLNALLEGNLLSCFSDSALRANIQKNLIPHLTVAFIQYSHNNKILDFLNPGDYPVIFNTLIERKNTNVYLSPTEEILISMLQGYCAFKSVPNIAKFRDEDLSPRELLLGEFVSFIGGYFFPHNQTYLLPSPAQRETNQRSYFLSALLENKAVEFSVYESSVGINNLDDEIEGSRLSEPEIEHLIKLSDDFILVNPLWQDYFMKESDSRWKLIGDKVPDNLNSPKKRSNISFLIGLGIGVFVTIFIVNWLR